jgi:hypothetical protein
MYWNRVLMKAKDAEDPLKTNQRAYVKSMQALMQAQMEVCVCVCVREREIVCEFVCV